MLNKPGKLLFRLDFFEAMPPLDFLYIIL